MAKSVDKYGNEFVEGVHKVKKDGRPMTGKGGSLIVIDDPRAQGLASASTGAIPDLDEVNSQLEKSFGSVNMSDNELAAKVVRAGSSKDVIIQARRDVMDADLKDSETYDPLSNERARASHVYDYNINDFENTIRNAMDRIVAGWGTKIIIEVNHDDCTWEFRSGGKRDSGTLKQPIRVIANCARTVCAMHEVRMDGSLQL